ncbi:hypothetical protein V2J09_005281 [Rumex salicifolius]
MTTQAEDRHSHQRRRNSHHQPPDKLKPPNRTFFSCSFFRHCAQSPLSPTQTQPSTPPTPPPVPPTPVPAVPPPENQQNQPKGGVVMVESTSESSSSSTSQSFTQWRFPPTFHHPIIPPPPPPISDFRPESIPPLSPPQPELHPRLPPLTELQFTAGSDGDRLAALHMLERFIVRNPPTDTTTSEDGGGDAVVPAAVLDGVLAQVKQKPGAKSATKVLLALCLEESNRRAAVERGAAGSVVEALADLDGAAAERALAALELMCTVAEGAAEVRAHALAVPILVTVMGKMEGRGREYAISVLAVVFGGGEEVVVCTEAPPEQVARAVVLAMQQGDCSARGRRKGAQLLKALQSNSGEQLL